MKEYTNNPIYRNVNESFVLLKKSIESFEKSLQERNSLELRRVYYFAKGCHKAAQEYYQKALNNARRLIKQKRDWLEKDKILVRAVVFEDLQAELIEDEVIKNWISEEEIKFFLNQHFQEQTRGKRKLSNIKLRMIFKKLEKALQVAQGLEKNAKKYYMSKIS